MPITERHGRGNEEWAQFQLDAAQAQRGVFVVHHNRCGFAYLLGSFGGQVREELFERHPLWWCRHCRRSV